MMKKCCHIAFFLVLLMSCQQELELLSPAESDDSAGVSLTLSVAPSLTGTPETRSVDDPDIPGQTSIQTLCILQYAGTNADAPLVGDVVYLHSDADGRRPLDLNRIPLTDSEGARHTLIILANTFAKIQPAPTLGQMKELYRNIYSAEEVPGSSGSVVSFPDGGDFYQRLHGIAVTEVSDGKSIAATLHRSHARIRVHLSNDGTDGLAIRSVRLCNVAERDYYLTDYSFVSPDDGSIQQLFDTPFQTTYDVDNPLRSDFDPADWTGNPDGTGEADYLWLIPANMRGTDPHITEARRKNLSLLADGATCLEVIGAYGVNHDTDIVYRFYLGADLVNDFNICPNTAYSYRFSFEGKGTTQTDSRIQEFPSIDFEYDANSYILNPPRTGTRTYSFNVVHRINTFWGDRYGLNASYPNYSIDATKQWKAYVLWSDRWTGMTKEEALAFMDKKEGTGAGNYMSDTQRIRITIPADIPHGNVVIGVYTDDPDVILWSWHLWITDYSPDDIVGTEPVQGQYIYQVGGGAVHRYGGAAWGPGGRYKNGFAMDRDIGSYGPRLPISSYDYRSAMLYQFGRKDPFISRPSFRAQGYYFHDTEGNRRYYFHPGISYSNLEPITGGANVPYSVNHPTLFIYGNSAWTTNDIYNPETYDSNIVWQDPYCTNVTEREEKGKSIFDPCPQGWRVPNNNTYNNYDNWISGFTSSGSNPTFSGNYYPLGIKAGKSPDKVPVVYFKSCYYRDTSNKSNGDYAYHWTTTTESNTAALRAYFNNYYSRFSMPRSYGILVRCVKE